MADILNMLDDMDSTGDVVLDGSSKALTEEPSGDVAKVSVVPDTPLAEVSDDELRSLMDAPSKPADDDDDDPFMGLHQEGAVNLTEKPWMKHHKFIVVRTLDELRGVIDAAIAAGSCSLDTETEGLDSRIDYVDGKPQTKHKIVGYCISYDGVTGYYIPVRHHPEDMADPNIRPIEAVEAEISRLCHAAQPVIAENDPDQLGSAKVDTWKQKPKVVIYFWNAKFDQEMLYPVTGIDYWHPESFEDGQLAVYVYNPNDKNISLKDQAKKLLQDPDGNPYEMIELRDLFAKGREVKVASLHPEDIRVYGGSDGICTYKICKLPMVQEVITTPKYKGTYRIEKQVACVIRVMERNRMQIDVAEVAKLIEEAEAEAAELLRKVRAVAESRGFKDFNPTSGKQIGDLLFSDQGLNLPNKPEKTDNGQYKTDKTTLESLVDDLPDSDAEDNVLVWIVKYKQIDKVKGTYLDSMQSNVDENQCLRFSFFQCGTATGRFTAPAGKSDHGFSGIPIHGIPARNDPKKPHCANSLRRMFRAREGYTLAKCDYAGQELRIVANVSQEPLWIKEFLEGEGDLHTVTGRILFGKDDITKDERGKAKAFNFAVVYGGGQAAIIRILGCDKYEANNRKAAFDRGLSVFAKWVKKQHEIVVKDGGITNSFYRWIPIPESQSKIEAVVAGAKRCSSNYPIQSAGADIMKMSLIMLHKKFAAKGWLRNGGDDSVRMLLTVHDEIVFEIKHERVAEAIPLIVEVMESPSRMKGWRVPLVVEPLVGRNWDGKYDWAHMRKGRSAKPTELAGDVPKGWELVGNRVYQKVPEWLEGLLTFDREGGNTEPTGGNSGGSSGGPPEQPTAPVQNHPETPPESLVVSPPTLNTGGTLTPTSAQETPAPNLMPSGMDKQLLQTYVLEDLNHKTVALVCEACHKTTNPEYPVLCVTDLFGEVLISPELGIRVNPVLFTFVLEDKNIRIGAVD